VWGSIKIWGYKIPNGGGGSGVPRWLSLYRGNFTVSNLYILQSLFYVEIKKTSVVNLLMKRAACRYESQYFWERKHCLHLCKVYNYNICDILGISVEDFFHSLCSCIHLYTQMLYNPFCFNLCHFLLVKMLYKRYDIWLNVALPAVYEGSYLNLLSVSIWCIVLECNLHLLIFICYQPFIFCLLSPFIK